MNGFDNMERIMVADGLIFENVVILRVLHMFKPTSNSS